MDLTLYYGGEGCRGNKVEMAEEEKDINNTIMKKPVMTEEELVEIINRQRNGKAAGANGVRAELLKYLVKNKVIRGHLLKCFNKCLNEEIQEDWLYSKTTMIPKTNKPLILEHRPIVVTVLSSKIMCTFYREKIKEHLK